MSPETTSTWPRAYLWPSMPRHRKRSAPELRRVLEGLRVDLVEHLASIPMSATRTRPHCMRPGSSRCAGFLRKKVTVSVGAHRGPHDGSRGAVDAARQIDREHRRAVGVDRLDHRARLRRSTGRLKPGAEQRIDDQRGLADRLRIERQHRIFPAARGGRRIALAARRARTSGSSRPRGPGAASSAAATNPSPPLLPGPATTRIGPSSTRSLRGAPRPPGRRSASARSRACPRRS